MIGLCILFGCWLIADSICFVHGFESTFWTAKSIEEREVLRKIKERV
jgi:hypothetical protein